MWLLAGMAGAGVALLSCRRREVVPNAATTHTLRKLSAHVWRAEPPDDYEDRSFNSASTIVVGTEGVLVVDTHISPRSARALIADIATITDKPVRWVVNTHFHYDHVHGNEAFPGATIVGSEFTRSMMLAGESLRGPTWAAHTSWIPGDIERLRSVAGTRPLSAEETARLAGLQAFSEETSALHPVAPSVTTRSSLSVFLGGESGAPTEVQVRFFGRGHTAGDLVVYVPAEHVLCAGDLLDPGAIHSANDAWVDEWPATLENLNALDVETLSTSHGGIVEGGERYRELISRSQSYLRDLWKQVAALRTQGLSAHDAAGRVDLHAFKGSFPQIPEHGVAEGTVTRIYEVMDGNANP